MTARGRVGALLVAVLTLFGLSLAPLLDGGEAYAVGSTPSSIVVVSSALTAPAGAVTFTATVTPAAATGTVSFFDGGTAIGTGALDGSGHATFTTPFLTIGTHSMRAAYPGDATYAASGFSATISQKITGTVDCSTATAVVHDSPPPDDSDDAYVDLAAVHEFDERQDVAIPTGGRNVDFVTGTHYQQSDFPSPVPSIPAGTLVRSHMLHADHIGTQDVSYTGCYTFDSDVIGVEAQNTPPSLLRLDASDFLGAPGTVYESTGNAGSGTRGIDFSQLEDVVSVLPDQRTVAVHFDVSTSMDEIRVFTQGSNLHVAKAGTGDGTVTSSPAGISCGTTCDAALAGGSSVTLSAVPDATSTFASWSGCDSTAGASCTVTLTGSRSVTATFTRNTPTLSVSLAGTGGGSVASTPAGISCGATCSASYLSGTSVTLTPTPDATSTFAGWSGCDSTTGTQCTVAMNSARSVTATFSRITFALTVTLAGTGGGSVASSPAGISCGATCSASFVTGTLVTLTPTPDATSVFAGWSGACSGTGACAVSMTAARAVTAAFTRVTFPLTVTLAGTGGGSVASSPAGISCGAICAADYVTGTSVTLTPTPDATSTFAGWSGACSGTGACAVSMTAARAVTASFTRVTFPLTVTLAGTGGGSVASSPAGISCGSTCAADYVTGTSVTLTPTSDATSTFAGWSGCDSTSGNQCTVAMTSAKSVTASFTQIVFPLTVTLAGTGGGSVASSPGGISCGSTCSADFAAGTSVTLTATPDATSVFAGWGGACSGAGACVVSMTAARSVTASFTRVTFPLTVTLAGTGGGSVTSSPTGISCGSTCSADFVTGTSVTLTATPDATSAFAGWIGFSPCSGTGTCTVSMTAARSVIPMFVRIDYALNVTRTGTGTGTVSSSPAGISCGSTCSVTYVSGTSVTLSATPDVASTFAGWIGCDSTNGNQCTVAMSSAKSVSASFVRDKNLLVVGLSGSGGGTVTSSPPGISCGTTCSAAFAPGTLVTLTITPDAASFASGWSCGCHVTSVGSTWVPSHSMTMVMDQPTSSLTAYLELTGAVNTTLPGPGTVTSTAPLNYSTPVRTSVSTTTGGAVAISRIHVGTAAPAGYGLSGLEIDITAPPATAADPLAITFEILPGLFPAGSSVTTTAILRNGAVVQPCASQGTRAAAPDPCVFKRATVGGVWIIGVYTSHASHWNFASPPKVLTITTASLPNATHGKAYTAKLSALGSTSLPLKWKKVTKLPKGLKLNAATGVISGTPKAAGSFSVTLQVTDAHKPKASATKTFTLKVV